MYGQIIKIHNQSNSKQVRVGNLSRADAPDIRTNFIMGQLEYIQHEYTMLLKERKAA